MILPVTSGVLVVPTRKITVDLESLSLSEEAAEAIEEQILHRRRPEITDQ